MHTDTKLFLLLFSAKRIIRNISNLIFFGSKNSNCSLITIELEFFKLRIFMDFERENSNFVIEFMHHFESIRILEVFSKLIFFDVKTWSIFDDFFGQNYNCKTCWLMRKQGKLSKWSILKLPSLKVKSTMKNDKKCKTCTLMQKYFNFQKIKVTMKLKPARFRELWNH